MNDKISKAIKELGFSTQTEVQEKSIPLISEGRDLMAQAHTGSGKTAAFVIPILDKLLSEVHSHPSTLIIAPTRELVQQIDKHIGAIGKYTDIKHLALYGGVNKQSQMDKIRENVDIITATPGRLTDILVNESVDLSTIKYLVIDEADRMLDIEMKTNIMDIVSFLPKDRQTLFFSATFPLEISLFAKKMLHKPAFVASSHIMPTPKNIVFEDINVDKKDKIDTLIDILRNNKGKNIVFTNTIHCANFLNKLISCKDLDCINLHSQRSQHQREKAIEIFSNNEHMTLIATDIAARGIDIPNVELVINFDKPKGDETRIHRAGRTGRMAKKGRVITFNN